MNNPIKKSVLFYRVFLFILSAPLYATQDHVEENKPVPYRAICSKKREILIYGYCNNNLLPEIAFLIRCFVYDNPYQYRGRKLPSNLSNQDLAGFDFTGCQFTYTNLTDTNLEGIILINTSCDYRKILRNNIKNNQVDDSWNWPPHLFLEDLTSIFQVYPLLTNDTHKAKLLHIASDLSRLPLAPGNQFNTQAISCSRVLCQLKKSLAKLGHQLTCSLESHLQDDDEYYSELLNFRQKEEYQNSFIKYNEKCKKDLELARKKKEILKSVDESYEKLLGTLKESSQLN